jgi:hypothetical protein
MQIYYSYRYYKFLLLIAYPLKELKVFDSSFLLRIAHILIYINKFPEYTSIYLMLNKHYFRQFAIFKGLY